MAGRATAAGVGGEAAEALPGAAGRRGGVGRAETTRNGGRGRASNAA